MFSAHRYEEHSICSLGIAEKKRKFSNISESLSKRVKLIQLALDGK